jgi:hypothetical protein
MRADSYHIAASQDVTGLELDRLGQPLGAWLAADQHE